MTTRLEPRPIKPHRPDRRQDRNRGTSHLQRVPAITYFALYYALNVHVLRTKRRLRREYRARGEEFDRYYTQDRRMLTADRCLLNMLEHMPPFVCLLWLYV